MNTPQILLVAGEASSDMHGAHLLRQLKELFPHVHCFGVGGAHLKSEGMEITVPAEKLNVVGGADWLDKLGEVLRSFRKIKNEVRQRRPALAVLMDLPDFNLKLSHELKRLGIPVLYYISPQVWAWRKYRMRTLRRNIEKALLVFPFEKGFYDRHNVPASFVGHPLLEQIQPRDQYRSPEEVVSAPRIALLPGSRPSELRNHSALIRELAHALKKKYPGSELRIPVASTLSEERVRVCFPEEYLEIVRGDSRDTIRWADAAVVASGTATLETALVGTPFTLFYRLNRSTAWVVKHLVRYRRFFGMPNLLLGREAVREFVQEKATAQALLQECVWMIESPDYRERLVRDLACCRKHLGETGASRRAAEECAAILRRPTLRKAALVPSLA